ncbi:hypothetical protein ACFX15_003290 [Malus domestica]
MLRWVALLTSASYDCGRERNTSRPLGLSNLKTRLLFLRSSISNSAFNVPNVIIVTPHFAEKADEMTSTNKGSETLLDRDLDSAVDANGRCVSEKGKRKITSCESLRRAILY